MDVIMNL